MSISTGLIVLLLVMRIASESLPMSSLVSSLKKYKPLLSDEIASSVFPLETSSAWTFSGAFSDAKSSIQDAFRFSQEHPVQTAAVAAVFYDVASGVSSAYHFYVEKSRALTEWSDFQMRINEIKLKLRKLEIKRQFLLEESNALVHSDDFLNVFVSYFTLQQKAMDLRHEYFVVSQMIDDELISLLVECESLSNSYKLNANALGEQAEVRWNSALTSYKSMLLSLGGTAVSAAIAVVPSLTTHLAIFSLGYASNGVSDHVDSSFKLELSGILNQISSDFSHLSTETMRSKAELDSSLRLLTRKGVYHRLISYSMGEDKETSWIVIADLFFAFYVWVTFSGFFEVLIGGVIAVGLMVLYRRHITLKEFIVSSTRHALVILLFLTVVFIISDAFKLYKDSQLQFDGRKQLLHSKYDQMCSSKSLVHDEICQDILYDIQSSFYLSHVVLAFFKSLFTHSFALFNHAIVSMDLFASLWLSLVIVSVLTRSAVLSLVFVGALVFQRIVGTLWVPFVY